MAKFLLKVWQRPYATAVPQHNLYNTNTNAIPQYPNTTQQQSMHNNSDLPEPDPEEYHYPDGSDPAHYDSDTADQVNCPACILQVNLWQSGKTLLFLLIEIGSLINIRCSNFRVKYWHIWL